MNRNEAVIVNQREILTRSLSKLLAYGSNYALLDFPHYPNVGDSALWLGGLKLLSDISGRAPGYLSTIEKFNPDQLLEGVPEGPIFLSGGGNFGDIWPWFQEFREMILEKFKDRLIVQLPQTISYINESSIQRSAKVIQRHPNFYLLVRDQPSFDFAASRFQCPMELLPDTAFGLGMLKRPLNPSCDVFMLLREDAERASYDRSPLIALPNSTYNDWLIEPSDYDQSSKTTAAFKALLSGSWPRRDRRLVYFKQLANGRLNRGLKMLASGKRVITDRLHAHILSILLDIPHVALDNNYGKISSYIAAWTNSYPGVQTAKTAEEAIEKLHSLPLE